VGASRFEHSRYAGMIDGDRRVKFHGSILLVSPQRQARGNFLPRPPHRRAIGMKTSSGIVIDKLDPPRGEHDRPAAAEATVGRITDDLRHHPPGDAGLVHPGSRPVDVWERRRRWRGNGGLQRDRRLVHDSPFWRSPVLPPILQL
jgi:hypothetical protein